jgi:hypothetical protein
MSEQLTMTIDPLADVLAWRRRNPEAWQFIVDLAHEDRGRGITPSTRYYCCVLRRPEHARRLGLERGDAPVLVNDHLSSGLARLLNREYPDLACPTRAARVDEWSEAS